MTEQKILLDDLKKALRHLNKTDWRSAGFNMAYWAKNKRPESPELNCGTVCCAYGVGTTLSSWKEAGLRLKKTDSESVSGFEAPRRSRYKLDLSEDQWEHIFCPSAYFCFSDNISPAHVIKHIDDVLKGKV